MSRRHPGFTIVELVIVILVIGILSAIVIVSYQGVQVRARDAKLADAADKIKDAVQLFVANNGHFPKGSFSSTTAIGTSKECVDGTGSGWFSPGISDNGQYACSVEETLVASGYLTKGFTSDLSQDSSQYPDTPRNRGIMVYIMDASTRKAMVFYYMENPSSSDTAHFNAELTKCGLDPAGAVPQRTDGMRNGTCFNY